MANVFTAKAKAVGGRAGHIQSDDKVLDLNIVMPNEKKNGETGTNPEQLFAAGYAACFGGALQHVAKEKDVTINAEVEGEVSLLKDESDGGFKIGVRLIVTNPGIDEGELKELVHDAHDFCPYSKATRGNIDVELEIK
jgi:Ohr subfamily peroxiredoxin